MSRDADLLLLPRLDRSLEERVQIALAWYQDGVRASDIATVCKFSNHTITAMVLAAGLPLRQGRAEGRSLRTVLRSLEVDGSGAVVAAHYDLSGPSLEAAQLLLRVGRNGAAPTGRPRNGRPEPKLPLLLRCWKCGQLQGVAPRCRSCDAPQPAGGRSA